MWELTALVETLAVAVVPTAIVIVGMSRETNHLAVVCSGGEVVVEGQSLGAIKLPIVVPVNKYVATHPQSVISNIRRVGLASHYIKHHLVGYIEIELLGDACRQRVVGILLQVLFLVTLAFVQANVHHISVFATMGSLLVIVHLIVWTLSGGVFGVDNLIGLAFRHFFPNNRRRGMQVGRNGTHANG